MDYFIPVLIFAVLGIVSGMLLTFASKIFAVKKDERIEKINNSLPNANCGACGYAGCADYADAIVKNNAPANLCRLGGADVTKLISKVMGVEAEIRERSVAVLHCNGNCNVTSKKFDFSGLDSCKAVSRFYGGDGLCAYGCIGLGDCVKVCEGHCISIKDKIANINISECVSCGKCVKTCPHGLFSLRPVSKYIEARCSSKDNGKITSLVCKNGCIACKLCEKKCPSDAIHVIDFHSVIDYDKCINCGECYKVCPTGTIVNTMENIICNKKQTED